MAEQYLVLDIGGTFIKYAIMDREAQFIEQGKVPAQTGSEEEMLASLADLREAVAAFDYEGVAISMPGRIDTAKGWAHTGGAFAWLHEYPAAEKYGAVFGKPCTIANDGKCAAYAESWTGALANVDSGCVLVLGTGIGGGIVLDRKVWMGCSGGAGELSIFGANFDAAHNPAMVVASPERYMWARRVSAKAIVEFYEEAKGAEKGSLDGVALFDAYEAGEPEAVQVIDEFAVQMGAGIMSLQSVLDVQRYAIGGGISARPATTEVVRAKVNELFDANPWLPFSKPEVVTCQFGNEANLIGALAFHLQRIS
jgi:predicted NBD/HSP70 family sugar kinase